ncbi:MAG: D-ala-D-ala transporter subunit [Thermotoga sp. 4484_232]|nr:ABC transporter permease [Thermotogaceae bacterium]OQX57900.1 MAG: D-ala-D-ala transporter subunit [Thermotoga sp. 4484_232]RKX41490.1 MAG: D,D-dipeptide ABC transporter permease [Thermotogota bacterium]RKX52730.1 MAG: D,D-dipeptide ABC transporter permease [Thermotoga sp.]RKX57247.1 MAG: D,D-dipeptide ABC transporter permease [Thermotoga sp.]
MYLWRKNKLAMIGTVIILGFIIVAIFAPVLAPYDPYQQNLHNRLAPPSREHLLGTDQFGRDVLSRIIWGTRIELKIIFLVTVISTAIGTIIGLISGYFGGAVDEILMRITDMFLAFPSLVLAMAFAAALGPSLTNAIIAISVITWTVYARLVRAETMKIKSTLYIEAIRALGAGTFRILFLHILPMTISPILVQMTLRMGTIILTAAGLGFLGLGAQPPTPEWGAMVSDGRLYMMNAWWISTFSGLAIALVVLGFNLLGDGIRDILDPRLRR